MSEANAVWPLPSFHFAVAIDGEHLSSIGEVIGLGARSGADGVHANNIVLRAGLFVGDLTLWRWFDRAAAASVSSTVTIDLLDERGGSVRRWTLSEARPVRYSGPALRSDANEVAVEEIEIACGRLTVTIPDDTNEELGLASW